MLQPHHRVAVAVSGGPDSVCLLQVLRELAPRLPLRLSVAHFNHNLRAESGKEAEFVEKLAVEAGLPFHIGSAEPGELANAEDSNLPQAARQARYRFLHGLQQQNQVDRIAVAHTLDDQAETVLLRLLRGSGTTGLAAIHPVTPGHVVRPLLDIRRQQVISFLEERSLPWLNDPTNANLDYSRARMRHMLLPQLREQWNSQLDAALGHTASLAYEEELYWQQQAERWIPQLGEWRGTAAFVTDVRLWQELPPALRRRVLRPILEQARSGQTALRPLDFEHVEGALRLLAGEDPQARLQLPGLDVWRSYQWLRVAPLSRDTLPGRFWEFAVAPPCRVALPDSASWLQLTHVQRDGYSAEQPAWAYNVGGCSLNTDLLQQPLQARSWRPGDALARSGNKLLKTLFQDARIPLWERRSWPVLTAGGTIVWTRRFGVADGFAAPPQARIVLRVWETSESKSYVGTSV